MPWISGNTIIVNMHGCQNQVQSSSDSMVIKNAVLRHLRSNNRVDITANQRSYVWVYLSLINARCWQWPSRTGICILRWWRCIHSASMHLLEVVCVQTRQRRTCFSGYRQNTLTYRAQTAAALLSEITTQFVSKCIYIARYVAALC